MNPRPEPFVAVSNLRAALIFRVGNEGTSPFRDVLDSVCDTWSLVIIANLQAKPLRFNALRRAIDGISQRMLTVALRSLERHGFVSRTVRSTTPPEVEYSLTELGHSIAAQFDALASWAMDNRERIRSARRSFDASRADA